MSEGQEPGLSVVIVNYNTREDVLACLRALSRSPEELQIIVVDNASEDGSAAAVRSEFPRVELLAMPENRWYCGGNNLGLARARRKYVMLLNPDTEVEANTLTQMVEFMDQNPQYDGCTGQMHYPNGAIQKTGSRIPTFAYLLIPYSVLGILMPGLRKRHWREHSYESWDRGTDRDIAVMPGSCYLMRRSAFGRALLIVFLGRFVQRTTREGSEWFTIPLPERGTHHASRKPQHTQPFCATDLLSRPGSLFQIAFWRPAWALWWCCALPLRLWMEWRPRR